MRAFTTEQAKQAGLFSEKRGQGNGVDGPRLEDHNEMNFVPAPERRGDLKRFSERTRRDSKSSRSFFLIK